MYNRKYPISTHICGYSHLTPLRKWCHHGTIDPDLGYDCFAWEFSCKEGIPRLWESTQVIIPKILGKPRRIIHSFKLSINVYKMRIRRWRSGYRLKGVAYGKRQQGKSSDKE